MIMEEKNWLPLSPERKSTFVGRRKNFFLQNFASFFLSWRDCIMRVHFLISPPRLFMKKFSLVVKQKLCVEVISCNGSKWWSGG